MTPARIAELRVLAESGGRIGGGFPLEMLDEIDRLRAALVRIRDEWPRCEGHPACRDAPAVALVCETCGERWNERALDVIGDALEGRE